MNYWTNEANNLVGFELGFQSKVTYCVKSQIWGSTKGTYHHKSISFAREVISVYFYANWAAASAAGTRLQFIEFTLDDDSKVSIGTETAAITTAKTSAVAGTLNNGSLLVSLNGKGRFIGLEIRQQVDALGQVYMMGTKVLYNSSTKCDIANTSYVQVSTGSDFTCEVIKETVIQTLTIVNPLQDKLGLVCNLTGSLLTTQTFLTQVWDAASKTATLT